MYAASQSGAKPGGGCSLIERIRNNSGRVASGVWYRARIAARRSRIGRWYVRDTSGCCAGPLRAIGVSRQAVRASNVAKTVNRLDMETRNTRTTECEDVDVDNTAKEIRTRDDQERHLTDERSTPMRLA